MVQEAFLRLCNQDPGALGEKVDVWLFTVCRNLCTDMHRREGRMTPLENQQVDLVAGPAPAPDEAAEAQDEYGLVMETLGSLPPKQQEVLRLKFQDGLSYKEISRVTKDSVGTVGWLLHMGLKGLRTKLGTSDYRGAKA